MILSSSSLSFYDTHKMNEWSKTMNKGEGVEAITLIHKALWKLKKGVRMATHVIYRGEREHDPLFLSSGWFETLFFQPQVLLAQGEHINPNSDFPLGLYIYGEECDRGTGKHSPCSRHDYPFSLARFLPGIFDVNRHPIVFIILYQWGLSGSIYADAIVLIKYAVITIILINIPWILRLRSLW